MPTLYPLLTGTKNVAATEHYLSAAAAARLFATGANAVDAAIAAALVEGVVNPHLHTIGGEAPMLIYFASAAKAFAINGNMRAPGKATIEKYRSLGLKLVPPEGLLAAGVPSAFDAFAVALRQFGTRSLREVAEPALELCEVGFPMHPGLGGEGQVADGTAGAPHPLTIKANAQKFLKEWPSTARLYMPGGKVPASGT